MKSPTTVDSRYNELGFNIPSQDNGPFPAVEPLGLIRPPIVQVNPDFPHSIDEAVLIWFKQCSECSRKWDAYEAKGDSISS